MSSNGGSGTCPIGSTQSVAESVREAAETALPGMARIREGREAVMLEDLRALAKADREKVRRLEAKRLWGVSDLADLKEPEMGNLVLAGDIHVDSPEQIGRVLSSLSGQSQPQPQSEPEPTKTKIPGWAKIAGAALLGSGLGAGGLAAMKTMETTVPPAPAVHQAADRWNEYDIEKWVPENSPNRKTEAVGTIAN